MEGFQIKRVYDEPSLDDGYRVLVDRLWPRGVSKDKAKLDEWSKELAPSSELRTWFGHKSERFEEFTVRYTEELKDQRSELDRLCTLAQKQRVTLLYGTKDPQHNQAVILLDILNEMMK